MKRELMIKIPKSWIILCMVAVLLMLTTGEVSAQVETTRVSVDSAGVQGNGGSYDTSISSDGRYVAFESDATNLVTGDSNSSEDIFVHDRNTGQTTRVSIDSAGVQGNSDSYLPSISSDGRYVAFLSDANNLVTGDSNSSVDIFVHDRNTGQTTRVSIDSAGVQGNDHSYNPSISSDGRYVAFWSDATNLVTGDTNGVYDIFVHDRNTGQTTRVSIDSAGVQGNDHSSDPSISSDGRYVAFDSRATNLVTGDSNSYWDTFVHDRNTGQTTRVSVDSAGVQGNSSSYRPSISSDGRYVAFVSYATNLVTGDTNGDWDIFVHDRNTGQTTRVSVDSAGVQGNSYSYNPFISSDGRYVAFVSYATNLVTGDTNSMRDIFVHDRNTGQTTRVSIDSAGVQGNSYSYNPSISSDGRYVAFDSYATNLVTGDTNGVYDIFVHGCAMSFSDVSGHWAEDYINAIYCAGITIGYGDGTYRPEDVVNRAQMAAFIIRALYGESFSYSSTPYFHDVSASHWAFKYVQRLYEDGITIGYGDGTYRPETNVSRAQMAAFLIRTFYGESFSYSSTRYFHDVSASHWAFKYVQRLYEDGITIGYGDGTYRPETNVSRAQMAAFLARAFLGMP